MKEKNDDKINTSDLSSINKVQTDNLTRNIVLIEEHDKYDYITENKLNIDNHIKEEIKIISNTKLPIIRQESGLVLKKSYQTISNCEYKEKIFNDEEEYNYDNKSEKGFNLSNLAVTGNLNQEEEKHKKEEERDKVDQLTSNDNTTNILIKNIDRTYKRKVSFLNSNKNLNKIKKNISKLNLTSLSKKHSTDSIHSANKSLIDKEDKEPISIEYIKKLQSNSKLQQVEVKQSDKPASLNDRIISLESIKTQTPKFILELRSNLMQSKAKEKMNNIKSK